MSAALLALLNAIPLIMADAPKFASDWAAIKALFSPQTQATVDALLAALNPTVDADLSGLEADARAAASGQPFQPQT